MTGPKAVYNLRRRIDDPGRVVVGAGGEDGVDEINGILDAWSAIDGEPSFECDLALVTSPAAAYHDRIEVRRTRQGHLELVPRHVVISDRRYGKAVVRGQFDGQFAEPRSGEVPEVTLAASKVFHRCQDVIGSPLCIVIMESPPRVRDHVVDHPVDVRVFRVQIRGWVVFGYPPDPLLFVPEGRGLPKSV